LTKALPALLVLPVVLAFGVRTGAHVTSSAATLPADGTASATLRVGPRSLFGLPAPALIRPRLSISFDEGASRVRAACSVHGSAGPSCVVVAGVNPGRVSGTLKLEDALGMVGVQGFGLELLADDGDADRDGFPDAVELTSEEDRDAFRRWFAAVAEAQFFALDPAWPAVHRDCAGLLRFAYKEALRRHDQAWRSHRRYLPDSSMPDVAKYAYPQVPILGDRLFRVAPGPFQKGENIEETFSPTASAKWLVTANAVRIDRAKAGVGDLLFFEDPEAPGMSFHSMVYLGPADEKPAADAEPDGWVVYHTGPEGQASGTVRKVRLSQLLSHPDEKWRPRADNPHFLGFYRWKIVQ
jgi:uncharacterized protein YfaT (DUF1175 family)